jgi:hypothetical protein
VHRTRAATRSERDARGARALAVARARPQPRVPARRAAAAARLRCRTRLHPADAARATRVVLLRCAPRRAGCTHALALALSPPWTCAGARRCACSSLTRCAYRRPLPAQALTRWGGALLELAHFRQGAEAVEYIELVRPKTPQKHAISRAHSHSHPPRALIGRG